MIKCVIHVLCLSAATTVSIADIFTSSHKLSEMALNEDLILSALLEHIKEEYGRVDQLSNKYLDLVNELEHRPTFDLTHPNGMYHVVKRFARHYKHVLGPSVIDILQAKLNQGQDRIRLANVADYEGALRALLRLQEVYNLSVSAMIKGDYRGHLGLALGFDDAYHIGRMAFVDSQLDACVAWLEAALVLRQTDTSVAGKPRVHPSPASIQALMGRAHVRLKKLREAEDAFDAAYKEEPANGDVQALGQELKTLPVHTPQPVSESGMRANYSRLCRCKGPYHIENPDYKAMKCRYKGALLPYYVFREEILSVSPYVSLFYKVFSDEERSHLKTNVYRKLSRGVVIPRPGQPELAVSDFRTSDVAWLADAANPRTASLSKRVGLVTGLSVEQPAKCTHPTSGEEFQVVNYGLAGHYFIHMDPKKVADESGFRIATFLIYLSDVKEGGNTVFTRAGISVAPHKDTVLFWYNFPPAMKEEDAMTHHAGCPVIVGHKWIANKWIRSYGNSVHRPCGLASHLTQADIETLMVEQQKTIFHIGRS